MTRGSASPAPAPEPRGGPDDDSGDVGAVPVPQSPPAWLSETGREYWADLYRHLPPTAITATEVHALAMLCNALAAYADADAVVQQAGIIITDAVGGLVPNPALVIRDRAEAAYARWSAYLRITPADRGLYEPPPKRGARAELRHRREG